MLGFWPGSASFSDCTAARSSAEIRSTPADHALKNDAAATLDRMTGRASRAKSLEKYAEAIWIGMLSKE
jgi:hypothetical protein